MLIAATVPHSSRKCCNVLNQLRNKRNRPTVEPRQDALVPKVQPEPQAEEQNSPQELSPVTELANSTAVPV
ncbi:MAG: hypothetical protein ACYTX0_48225, partial [Nostoc sp.]